MQKMKLILLREEKTLPCPSGVTTLILVASVGLIAVSANQLMFGTQVGRAMFVLARVVASVIPHFIWLGAIIIVVFWLALLVWVWHS